MVGVVELRAISDKCRVPKILQLMINTARNGGTEIALPRKRLSALFIARLNNRGFILSNETIDDVIITTISWARE